MLGAVGQFAAVPWNALDADDLEDWQGGSLNLNIPAERVLEARRFEMEDIFRLTTPPMITEARESYAVEIEPLAADDSPVLVLGREIVGTITRPLAQVANQLEGSMVAGSDGAAIGEISEIMIDMDEGKVPYVLVSTGGFLGTGETFIPIPPQALRWETEGARYSIPLSSDQIQKLPALTGNNLAVYIRRSDLQELYDFYDVDPSWNAS